MARKSILLVLLIVSLVVSGQEKYVGGDISMVPSYEKANVQYLDRSGKRIPNLIEYFRDEAGFNIARVRLFVNPTKETGVVQDLDYVAGLSKRIKDAGLSLMLDFHYSDTWADPKAQWIPAAWTSVADAALPDTLYAYTKRVLERMTSAGATPDFIQTGNEISYGMLWGPNGTRTYYCHYDKDANWERLKKLLSEAGKACREICPEAKIIIHTERTNNLEGTKKIYNRLSSLDYDIIGLSYYPEWHDNISKLTSTLGNLHSLFPFKDIMLVETGYYNNWYPESATYDFTDKWPASPDGQKKFLDELVKATEKMEYMKGILYWFPEENPYKNSVYEPWYNHGLFNPNTGKVSEALFSLQSFRGITTGVEQLPGWESPVQTGSPIYTIDGRLVTSTDNLPCGIYIQNGKKIVR